MRDRRGEENGDSIVQIVNLKISDLSVNEDCISSCSESMLMFAIKKAYNALAAWAKIFITILSHKNSGQFYEVSCNSSIICVRNEIREIHT